MTCLVQEIYTHIHHLLGTGNLYTYTWPVWYRQFIHIYMTCLVQANFLYQAGDVYVYKFPVQNRSCIYVEIASTKQVMYMCIHFLYQTGDVYVYKLPVPPAGYRKFIHIYMTCLVQAIYTHIHDLFGTGNLYTYTSPVWSRQFIPGQLYVYEFPVPNRSCICVCICCTKQVMYMCTHCLYQAGGTGKEYTYTWPVWYRQRIHIYMTCLVLTIFTHIHDILGTGNLYTYTWDAWYRLFIHIYMTCVMYMCINCLYQTGYVYVYELPVPRGHV
jgi:hypothetical protein